MDRYNNILPLRKYRLAGEYKHKLIQEHNNKQIQLIAIGDVGIFPRVSKHRIV